MNFWDLFTWVSVAVLVIGALGIFAFFLLDLRGVLKGRGDPGDHP